MNRQSLELGFVSAGRYDRGVTYWPRMLSLLFISCMFGCCGCSLVPSSNLETVAAEGIAASEDDADGSPASSLKQSGRGESMTDQEYAARHWAEIDGETLDSGVQLASYQIEEIIEQPAPSISEAAQSRTRQTNSGRAMPGPSVVSSTPGTAPRFAQPALPNRSQGNGRPIQRGDDPQFQTNFGQGHVGQGYPVHTQTRPGYLGQGDGNAMRQIVSQPQEAPYRMMPNQAYGGMGVPYSNVSPRGAQAPYVMVPQRDFSPQRAYPSAAIGQGEYPAQGAPGYGAQEMTLMQGADANYRAAPGVNVVGSEFRQQPKMATEIMIELRDQNEILLAEKQQMRDQIDQLKQMLAEEKAARAKAERESAKANQFADELKRMVARLQVRNDQLSQEKQAVKVQADRALREIESLLDTALLRSLKDNLPGQSVDGLSTGSGR